MRNIFNNIEPEEMLSDPDPVKRAQNKMLAPLPKRFYQEVSVAALDDGFTIHLDGKSVRTPAKKLILLATSAAAQIVADEFDAQQEVVNPAKMPATRLVNTAIDGIATDPQAVAEDVLRFAASDMLCYRVANPQTLVERQREQWDPLLDWLADLGANFELTEGVMHIEQPREALAAFGTLLRPISDPVALAALHTMTTLTGSAILGLALYRGEVDLEHGWKIAHLDEDWTAEQWGEDEEAAHRRQLRKHEIVAADRLVSALGLRSQSAS